MNIIDLYRNVQTVLTDEQIDAVLSVLADDDDGTEYRAVDLGKGRHRIDVYEADGTFVFSL